MAPPGRHPTLTAVDLTNQGNGANLLYHPRGTVATEVNNEINSNALPGPAATAQAPIVVVTPPNVVTTLANAAGFNSTTNGTAFAWTSTSLSGGAINTRAYTQIFGHELVEAMTDTGSGGFEVSPGSLFATTFPAVTGNQIGDYEPNLEQYRYPDGTWVQPFYSDTYGKYIVPDGNTEEFDLKLSGTASRSQAPLLRPLRTP